jgi:hypothetical protein
VKDLQGPWNEMTDEMVPFIDGMLTISFQGSKLMNRLGRKISIYHVCPPLYLADERLDTIYSVYGCFHNMSTKNAASLEAGVEDILEYQDTQSTSII